MFSSYSEFSISSALAYECGMVYNSFVFPAMVFKQPEAAFLRETYRY